jgi:hypothetical protein
MPFSSDLSVKTIIKHHLINPLVVSFNHLNVGRLWETKGQFMRCHSIRFHSFPEGWENRITHASTER